MSASFKTAVAALAAFVLWGCGSKSVDPTVIPENLSDFNEQLAAGKVFTSALPLEGSPARLGKVIGVIDAPPDVVWKVVTQYDAYPEFMPLIVKSETKHLGGNSCELRQVYQLKLGGVNFGKLIPVSYWLRMRMNHRPEIYHIDWDMIEGEIRNTYGAWDLEPFGPGGQRTKLTYQLYFEIGNAVLDQSAKLLDEEVLPLVISSLRERVKTFNPDGVAIPECAKTREGPSVEEELKKAFEGMEMR